MNSETKWTDRHRKVLHDFYHLDVNALRDLVDAGLIDLTALNPKQLPPAPLPTYPNPFITDRGFDTVKQWQVVD